MLPAIALLDVLKLKLLVIIPASVLVKVKVGVVLNVVPIDEPLLNIGSLVSIL